MNRLLGKLGWHPLDRGICHLRGFCYFFEWWCVDRVKGEKSQWERFKKWGPCLQKVGRWKQIKGERYSTNQFYAVPPVAVLIPLSVILLWQQERQVAVVWLPISDGLVEVREIGLITIPAVGLRWRLNVNGMKRERMTYEGRRHTTLMELSLQKFSQRFGLFRVLLYDLPQLV